MDQVRCTAWGTLLLECKQQHEQAVQTLISRSGSTLFAIPSASFGSITALNKNCQKTMEHALLELAFKMGILV